MINVVLKETVIYYIIMRGVDYFVIKKKKTHTKQLWLQWITMNL